MHVTVNVRDERPRPVQDNWDSMFVISFFPLSLSLSLSFSHSSLHTIKMFHCAYYFLVPSFDRQLYPFFHVIRVIATTRNKQQQRFCEFIKPFLDRIFDLHLKVTDFEQLKIIGRGAFGQVALVKVRAGVIKMHLYSCLRS